MSSICGSGDIQLDLNDLLSSLACKLLGHQACHYFCCRQPHERIELAVRLHRAALTDALPSATCELTRDPFAFTKSGTEAHAEKDIMNVLCSSSFSSVSSAKHLLDDDA
jgi:hypothetical protein